MRKKRNNKLPLSEIASDATVKYLDSSRDVLPDEIKEAARWEKLFGRSRRKLRQMAADALADYHAGQTKPLDPDTR